MKHWLYIHNDKTVCVLLITVTVALYIRVTHFDFVDYDDGVYVLENQHVLGGLTVTGIKGAFGSTCGANWQPITLLSYMWDITFNKLRPGCQHLTNVMLHIMNTLLLFTILKGMTDKIWLSAFVAAVFALHPLHIESVAWISERKDMLSTLMGFLSIWAYAAYCTGGKRSQYLLALLFLILGLLSKPMLVTWPFLFLLLDYWPLNRLQITRQNPENASRQMPAQKDSKSIDSSRSFGHLILGKMPFIVVVGVFCVVTLLVEKSAMVHMGRISIPHRFVNAIFSYAWYIGKTVCPSGLCCLYLHPFDAGSPLTLWQVGGAGMLLLMVSLLAWWKRDHRYLVVGWLWYILTLLPVIGFVQVGYQGRADRYSYIPLIGLLVMIIWSIDELVQRMVAHQLFVRKIIFGAGVASIFAMLVCSSIQLNYWRDSASLFQRAIDVDPRNFVMLGNMSSLLIERREFDKAATYVEKALQANPKHKGSMNNMGVCWMAKGDSEKGEHYFQQVLEYDDTHATANYNMGIVRLVKGRFDDALAFFRKAAKAKPAWRWPVDEIAWILAVHPHPEPGFADESVSLAERLVEECGCMRCLDTLGIAYAAAGQFDRAIQTTESALILARQKRNESFILAAESRLALYKQGKPFRKEENQDGRRETDILTSRVKPQDAVTANLVRERLESYEEAKSNREVARPESEQSVSEEKVSKNQEQNAARLTEMLNREQTVNPEEEPEYNIVSRGTRNIKASF